MHNHILPWIVHAARAIAYFKDIREAHLLEQYYIEHRLPELPVAISHADICRHDLLFEIELDAVRTFNE